MVIETLTNRKKEFSLKDREYILSMILELEESRRHLNRSSLTHSGKDACANFVAGLEEQLTQTDNKPKQKDGRNVTGDVHSPSHSSPHIVRADPSNTEQRGWGS